MPDPSPRAQIPRVHLAAVTDDHLLRFREWFIASRPETQTSRPVQLKSPEETIAAYRNKEKTDAEADFAIVRTDDNVLVGRIRYYNLNPRNRSAEVGFLIGPEHQGKGYASAALGILLTLLFEEKGLNKVYAQTAEFNLPSVALLKRWGFRQDARLRRHHELDGVMHADLIFSLLAEEYRSKSVALTPGQGAR